MQGQHLCLKDSFATEGSYVCMLWSYAWAAVLGCPLLQVFFEFRINDYNQTKTQIFLIYEDALGRHTLKMVKFLKFEIENS